MNRFDIVGLGVSTLDQLHVVDELPGEELVQRAHESVLCGGGPVATAMVASARLGSRTAMIDNLGDDWRGRFILDEFRKEGVSTEGITTEKGRSSSMASILVRKRDGARTIVYSPGDAEEVRLSEPQKKLVASARILHLNGRHCRACMDAATMAREHGVMVSFDGGAHRYRSELRDLIAVTDVCIVARQFAFAFSGIERIESAAESLLRAGPAIVVITAGAEGSWVFEQKGRPFHQPAYQMDTVTDTTGAGDAFHGAFLHGLAKKLGLAESAALASAVGAMATQGLGGRSALPVYDEARRFMFRFR
jgi:sugar/nucleoside kinase (ribokinase family)